MSNTLGNIFRLTTFGESHGEAVGGVIDGYPAGIKIDEAFVQQELDRRRPGQSPITTGRQEADRVRFLSGIFEGKSTGAPIGFIIQNEDTRSQDYEEMRATFRPSHADYAYTATGAAADPRHASLSADAWPAHSPSWHCRASAYKSEPTPRRWATSF